MNSLLPTCEQTELFNPDQLPLGWELTQIEERERAGHTGERLARDRERYRAIVTALGQGLGVRQTARAFGVSPQTVSAIKARESSAVDTEKKEVSALMGNFVRMGIERLVEEVDEIPIGQLSVSVGIISDKKSLLDGDATCRVEVVDRSLVSPEAVKRILDEMRFRAAKHLETESVSVESPDNAGDSAHNSTQHLLTDADPAALDASAALSSHQDPGPSPAESGLAAAQAGGGVQNPPPLEPPMDSVGKILP